MAQVTTPSPSSSAAAALFGTGLTAPESSPIAPPRGGFGKSTDLSDAPSFERTISAAVKKSGSGVPSAGVEVSATATKPNPAAKPPASSETNPNSTPSVPTAKAQAPAPREGSPGSEGPTPARKDEAPKNSTEPIVAVDAAPSEKTDSEQTADAEPAKTSGVSLDSSILEWAMFMAGTAFAAPRPPEPVDPEATPPAQTSEDAVSKLTGHSPKQVANGAAGSEATERPLAPRTEVSFDKTVATSPETPPVARQILPANPTPSAILPTAPEDSADPAVPPTGLTSPLSTTAANPAVGAPRVSTPLASPESGTRADDLPAPQAFTTSIRGVSVPPIAQEPTAPPVQPGVLRPETTPLTSENQAPEEMSAGMSAALNPEDMKAPVSAKPPAAGRSASSPSRVEPTAGRMTTHPGEPSSPLPTTPASTPEFEVTRERQPRASDGEDHAAKSSQDRGFAMGATGSTSTTSNPAPQGIEAVRPGTSLDAIEGLRSEILNRVVGIREASPNSMTVTLRPDLGTELTVHLRNEAGRIDVTVRVERGSDAAFRSSWEGLQQSLSQRGVHLAGLETATSNSLSAQVRPQEIRNEVTGNAPTSRLLEAAIAAAGSASTFAQTDSRNPGSGESGRSNGDTDAGWSNSGGEPGNRGRGQEADPAFTLNEQSLPREGRPGAAPTPWTVPWRRGASTEALEHASRSSTSATTGNVGQQAPWESWA